MQTRCRVPGPTGIVAVTETQFIVVCLNPRKPCSRAFAHGRFAPPASFSTNPPIRLVDLRVACPDVFVDLVYSKPDNVFGRVLYPCEHAWLLDATAAKLAVAASEARAHGYALLVLDAYRPVSIQRVMWDLVPDDDFVAPPSRGSAHNRGAAVDVTLATPDGVGLPMPTEYDEFSNRASHDWDGAPSEPAERRAILRAIMERAGFSAYHAEWWHYSDPDHVGGPVLDIVPCCEAVAGAAPRDAGGGSPR